MASKFKTMRLEERAEQERIDSEAAIDLQTSLSAMIAEDARVSMTIYMFATSVGDEISTRSVHFQNYELLRVHGGMLFQLSTQETLNIIDTISHSASESVRVTVHTRSPGGAPMELANTPVFPVSALYHGTQDLVFDNTSSFVQFVMHADGGLDGIQWQSM
jgi:hypothetical protein